MANSTEELLTQLGQMSPQAALKNQYDMAVQLAQLRTQQQANNIAAGQMAGQGALGFPTYQTMQSFTGNPGQSPIQLPDLNGARTDPSILDPLLKGGAIGPQGAGSQVGGMQVGGQTVGGNEVAGTGSDGMVPTPEADGYDRLAQSFAQKGDRYKAVLVAQHAMEVRAKEIKQFREAQKAVLENRNVNSEIQARGVTMDKDRAEIAKMGIPTENQVLKFKVGDQEVSMVPVFKDGKFTGQYERYSGRNSMFNHNTDETAAQKGDEMLDLKHAMISADGVHGTINDLQNALKDPQVTTGWVNSGIGLVEKVTAGLKQLADVGVGSVPVSKDGADWLSKNLPSEFDKIATKGAVTLAQYSSLVYTVARLNAAGKDGGGGGQLNNNELRDAAEQVGKMMTNKGAAIQILEQLRKRTDAHIRSMYDNTIDAGAKSKITPLYQQYWERHKSSPSARTIPPTNAKGWSLHTDASGNKAYVSPDGAQFEEVQ